MHRGRRGGEGKESVSCICSDDATTVLEKCREREDGKRMLRNTSDEQWRHHIHRIPPLQSTSVGRCRGRRGESHQSRQSIDVQEEQLSLFHSN